MRNRILVGIGLLWSVFATAQHYQNNNLTCTYGHQHHSGKTDASTFVSIQAKPEGLECRVEVTDDLLFFDKSIYTSDHIEIWLAMDTTLRDGYNFNRQIYQTTTDDSLDEETFLSYLKSPHGFSGAPKEDAIRKDFDYTYDFTGMRHFGIDLETDLVHLFDAEQYFYFIPEGKITQFVQLQKKERTQSGYSYTFLVKPEALGFSPGFEWKEVYFMMDVFDADGSKNLSVLSTNPKRKWGIASLFEKMVFEKPYRLCEDQNPDKLAEVLYCFADNQWRCFYKEEKTNSPYDEYFKTNYAELTCERSMEVLSGGDTLLHRHYESLEITISELQGQLFNYSSRADDAFHIVTLRPKQYAILIKDCIQKNYWGMGPCGGCMSCEAKAYTLKNKKRFVFYEERFVDQEYRDEYSEDTVVTQGYFNSMRWDSPGKTLEFEIMLYEPAECEKQVCMYITISKNAKGDIIRRKKVVPCRGEDLNPNNK